MDQQLRDAAQSAVTTEAVDAAFALMWPVGIPAEMPNGYAQLAGALRRAAPFIVAEYLSRNCDCR